MPPAARTNDPTAHGNPLNPGPGSSDVLIGYMPAWRALPASMAAAVNALSDIMNSFMTKPQMTPADAAADLADISQSLGEAGAQAASAGAPAAAGAAASQTGTLNTTNATLTTTWTTASAAPGGQPAANIAYTEGIKAAAAAAASAVMSAMAGLSDMHICPLPCPIPPHGPGFVTQGSGTVVINNLAATRQGDKVMEACGGADPIAMGCTTVLIGDSGGGGGGGGNGGGGASGGGSSGGGGSTDDWRPDTPSPAPASEPEPPARTPGPSKEKVDEGVYFIEVEMVDEANQPVVGEPLIITPPPGEQRKEIRSALDSQGKFKVEGLKRSGPCQIRFPDLDSDAWLRWTAKPPPSPPAASAPPAPGAARGPVSGSAEPPSDGRMWTVRPGDCLSSIAAETGHFWHTLWNHSANAELKRRRGDPNVLLPGDAVFIPAKRQKTESGSTDQHHKFLRRGEPAWLDLKLVDADGPRANKPYTLKVAGRTRAGKTDAQGRIHEPLPGSARRAVLLVGSDVYHLQLGHLDPVDEITGVQARLNNLGFQCGPVDGVLGPRTLAALNQFRAHVGLPAADEVDDPTLKKLRDEHDAMSAKGGPDDGTDANDEGYASDLPEDLDQYRWTGEPGSADAQAPST